MSERPDLRGVIANERCWICKKHKGQPPERCQGHYVLSWMKPSDYENPDLLIQE